MSGWSASCPPSQKDLETLPYKKFDIYDTNHISLIFTIPIIKTYICSNLGPMQSYHNKQVIWLTISGFHFTSYYGVSHSASIWSQIPQISHFNSFHFLNTFYIMISKWPGDHERGQIGSVDGEKDEGKGCPDVGHETRCRTARAIDVDCSLESRKEKVLCGRFILGSWNIYL